MPGRTLNVRIHVDVNRADLVNAVTHLVCVDGMTIADAIASLPIGKYLRVTTSPAPGAKIVEHDEHWQPPAGHGLDLQQWDAVYERPHAGAD